MNHREVRAFFCPSFAIRGPFSFPTGGPEAIGEEESKSGIGGKSHLANKKH